MHPLSSYFFAIIFYSLLAFAIGVSAQVSVTPDTALTFRWPRSDSAPVVQHELISNARLQVLEIGLVQSGGILEVVDSAFFRIELLNTTARGRIILRRCRVTHIRAQGLQFEGSEQSQESANAIGLEITDNDFLPLSEINLLLTSQLTVEQQHVLVDDAHSSSFVRWCRASINLANIYKTSLHDSSGTVTGFVFSRNKLTSDYSTTVDPSSSSSQNAKEALAPLFIVINSFYSNVVIEENAVTAINGVGAAVIRLDFVGDVDLLSVSRNRFTVSGAWTPNNLHLCTGDFVRQYRAVVLRSSNDTNYFHLSDIYHVHQGAFLVDRNVFLQLEPRKLPATQLLVASCRAFPARSEIWGWKLFSISHNVVDMLGGNGIVSWQRGSFIEQNVTRVDGNIVRYNDSGSSADSLRQTLIAAASVSAAAPQRQDGIVFRVDGNWSRGLSISHNIVHNAQCGYGIALTFDHTWNHIYNTMIYTSGVDTAAINNTVTARNRHECGSGSTTHVNGISGINISLPYLGGPFPVAPPLTMVNNSVSLEEASNPVGIVVKSGQGGEFERSNSSDTIFIIKANNVSVTSSSSERAQQESVRGMSVVITSNFTHPHNNASTYVFYPIEIADNTVSVSQLHTDSAQQFTSVGSIVGIDVYLGHTGGHLVVQRNRVHVNSALVNYDLVSLVAAFSVILANDIATFHVVNNTLALADTRKCPSGGCAVLLLRVVHLQRVSKMILIERNVFDVNVSAVPHLPPSDPRWMLPDMSRVAGVLLVVASDRGIEQKIPTMQDPSIAVLLTLQGNMTGVRLLALRDNVMTAARAPGCIHFFSVMNAGKVELERVSLSGNKVALDLFDQSAAGFMTKTDPSSSSSSSSLDIAQCSGALVRFATIASKIKTVFSGVPLEPDIIQVQGHSALIRRFEIHNNDFSNSQGVVASLIHLDAANLTVANVTRSASMSSPSASSADGVDHVVSQMGGFAAYSALYPPFLGGSQNVSSLPASAAPRRAARSTCGVSSGFHVSRNTFHFSSSLCNATNACRFFTLSPLNDAGTAGSKDFIQMCLSRQDLNVSGAATSAVFELSASSSVAAKSPSPHAVDFFAQTHLHVSLENSSLTSTCNTGGWLAPATTESLRRSGSTTNTRGASSDCGIIVVPAAGVISSSSSSSTAMRGGSILLHVHAADSNFRLNVHGSPVAAFFSGPVSTPERSSVYLAATELTVVEMTHHSERPENPVALSVTNFPVGVTVEAERNVRFVHRDQQPSDQMLTLSQQAQQPLFRTLFAFSRFAPATKPRARPEDPVESVVPRRSVMLLAVGDLNISTASASDARHYSLSDLDQVDPTTKTTDAFAPSSAAASLTKNYAVDISCNRVNGAPARSSWSLYARTLAVSAKVNMLVRPCPSTATRTVSQSISEVPFCADFDLVPSFPYSVRRHASAGQAADDMDKQADVSVAAVRGSTQQIKFTIVPKALAATPVPLVSGSRYKTGPMAPPAGEFQSLSQTHFKARLKNISSYTDIQLIRRGGPPDLRIVPNDGSPMEQQQQQSADVQNSSSYRSTASKFTLSTFVYFSPTLDVDFFYTIRLNVSARLLSCRVKSGADYVQAEMKLSSRYSSGGVVDSAALAASYAAADVAAVLSLAASGATVGVAVTRLRALVSVFDCPVSASDSKLSFLESPFQWTSGLAWGSHFRGAIIGNVSLLAIVASCVIGVALVQYARVQWAASSARRERHKKMLNQGENTVVIFQDGVEYRVRRKSSPTTKQRQQQQQKNKTDDHADGDGINKIRLSLWDALGELQFPSCLFPLCAVLQQGTVASGMAVLLRRILHPTASGPNDNFLGGFAILLYLSLFGLFCFLVFHRRYGLPFYIESGLIYFRRTPPQRKVDVPMLHSTKVAAVLNKAFPQCPKCAEEIAAYKKRYDWRLELEKEKNKRTEFRALGFVDGESESATRRRMMKHPQQQQQQQQQADVLNTNHNHSPTRGGHGFWSSDDDDQAHSVASALSLRQSQQRRRQSSFEFVASFLMTHCFYVSGVWVQRANKALYLLHKKKNRDDAASGDGSAARSAGGGLSRASLSLSSAVSFAQFSESDEEDDAEQSQNRRGNRNNNNNNQRALDADPLFLSRWGRSWLSCNSECLWYSTYDFAEGFLLAIFSGYARATGVCNGALMLLTALVVAVGFVVLSWRKGDVRRRSTSNLYVWWMQLCALVMVMCGLVSTYVVRSVADAENARAASAIVLIIAHYSSLLLMIIDLLFVFFTVIYPHLSVPYLLCVHLFQHRGWRERARLLAADAQAEKLRGLIAGVTSKEQRRMQKTALEPEQRAKRVQQRVETFVAPPPLPPRKAHTPSVAWNLEHDAHVSTPREARPPPGVNVYTDWLMQEDGVDEYKDERGYIDLTHRINDRRKRHQNLDDEEGEEHRSDGSPRRSNIGRNSKIPLSLAELSGLGVRPETRMPRGRSTAATETGGGSGGGGGRPPLHPNPHSHRSPHHVNIAHNNSLLHRENSLYSVGSNESRARTVTFEDERSNDEEDDLLGYKAYRQQQQQQQREKGHRYVGLGGLSDDDENEFLPPVLKDGPGQRRKTPSPTSSARGSRQQQQQQQLRREASSDCRSNAFAEALHFGSASTSQSPSSSDPSDFDSDEEFSRKVIDEYQRRASMYALL